MPRKLALFLMIWVVSAFNAAIMAQDALPTYPKGLTNNFNDLARPVESENLLTLSSFVFDQVNLDRCTKVGAWSIVAVNSSDSPEITQAAKTGGTSNYENNRDYSLTIPQITLPPISSPAIGDLYLRISEQFELESYYDIARVRATTDGGSNWIDLGFRTGKSNWRDSYIDISALAGKSITLSFQLMTDASNYYSGWSIAKFDVVRPAIGAQVLSVNYNKFPLITVNSKIIGSLLGASQLATTNFTLNEDGQEIAPQSVLAPAGIEEPQAADIIFIMDYSVSMSGKRPSIISELSSFVARFQSLSQMNVRFGLCKYGSTTNLGEPIIVNPNLSNAQDIITLLNQATIEGTIEPAYSAIAKSANQFNFRRNASKYFILFTDEGVSCSVSNNNRITKTSDQVLNALGAVQGKLFAFISQTDPCAEETDLGPIARSTGGASYIPFAGNSVSARTLAFGLMSAYNDIVSSIGKSYRIIYTTPNKTGENARNIKVIVKY